MSRRGRSRTAGLVLGLAGCLGVGGLLGAAVLAGARGARAVAYRPDAAVSRPPAQVALVPGAFAIRDFDGDGERLYLLDPLAPAVRLLRWAGVE